MIWLCVPVAKFFLCQQKAAAAIAEESDEDVDDIDFDDDDFEGQFSCSCSCFTSVYLFVDQNDVIIFLFNFLLCEQMMKKKICLSTIWPRKQIHHLILEEKPVKITCVLCRMRKYYFAHSSIVVMRYLQVIPVPVLALDQTARVLTICLLRDKYTFLSVKELMMLVYFNLKVSHLPPSGF